MRILSRRTAALRLSAAALLIAGVFAQPVLAQQNLAYQPIKQADDSSASFTAGNLSSFQIWDSTTQINTIGNNINNNNYLSWLAINNANNVAPTQSSLTNEVTNIYTQVNNVNNTASVAYNNATAANNNANYANALSNQAYAWSSQANSYASSAVTTVQNLPAGAGPVPNNGFVNFINGGACGGNYLVHPDGSTFRIAAAGSCNGGGGGGG